MGTTKGILQQIQRQRDVVLELDHKVDDARAQVDGDVEILRDRVRERDRAADHLQQLITMAMAKAA